MVQLHGFEESYLLHKSLACSGIISDLVMKDSPRQHHAECFTEHGQLDEVLCVATSCDRVKKCHRYVHV